MEIMEFADGVLAPERRPVVRAALAKYPELMQVLESFLFTRGPLKDVYDEVLNAPIPDPRSGSCDRPAAAPATTRKARYPHRHGIWVSREDCFRARGNVRGRIRCLAAAQSPCRARLGDIRREGLRCLVVVSAAAVARRDADAHVRADRRRSLDRSTADVFNVRNCVRSPWCSVPISRPGRSLVAATMVTGACKSSLLLREGSYRRRTRLLSRGMKPTSSRSSSMQPETYYGWGRAGRRRGEAGDRGQVETATLSSPWGDPARCSRGNSTASLDAGTHSGRRRATALAPSGYCETAERAGHPGCMFLAPARAPRHTSDRVRPALGRPF